MSLECFPFLPTFRLPCPFWLKIFLFCTLDSVLKTTIFSKFLKDSIVTFQTIHDGSAPKLRILVLSRAGKVRRVLGPSYSMGRKVLHVL